MDKRIKAALPGIIGKLRSEPEGAFHALLGFDACIDNIVHVVKGRDKDGRPVFYNSSRDFSEFLLSREGKSCGVELKTKISKPGGNMVITANALGNLGVDSDCIGTFGMPGIHPVFSSLSGKCILHTVGETITTNALEFKDAKVMMADLGPYDRLSWNSIKNQMGIDTVRKLFTGKQLVCLLNWSEIENTSLIWRGILDEVLPVIPQDKKRPFLLTDLSDCSRKEKEDIRHAVELIGEFSRYFRVIFSMNQNEAEMIARSFDMITDNMNEDLIRRLYKVCSVGEIVIHMTKKALAFNGSEFAECPTFYQQNPAILTGGGDNFNGGYCYARLKNFNLSDSLILANAVSGHYVKTGKSPDTIELISFFESQE